MTEEYGHNFRDEVLENRDGTGVDRSLDLLYTM
jgi:hypothetical protein